MIVIAESGSTKTDWRLLDQNQTCYTSIGLNPYFVNAERISNEISPWISEIKNISEIHFYGTGITDQQKSDIIKEGILKALGYEVKIYTYSDVIAAAKSIFGKEEGLACILGTGSNSCHWKGTEIIFQIPPLGFWLGDEGSGGHLGKTLQKPVAWEVYCGRMQALQASRQRRTAMMVAFKCQRLPTAVNDG